MRSRRTTARRSPYRSSATSQRSTRLSRTRVLLIHWNTAEARARAARLSRARHRVNVRAPQGVPGVRALSPDPPEIVVIDLSRRPSDGLAVGVALRQQRAIRTRPQTPVVPGTMDAYSGTPLPKKLGIRADLDRRLPALARPLADGSRLWIAWPKQASGVATDATERTVRAAGLRAGLVDYKICAIDAMWSGLCFARRRARPDSTPAR